MGVNMNEIETLVTSAKGYIYDMDLLYVSVEQLFIAVALLFVVGILAACYQVRRNRLSRLAHIQAQKRWVAMQKRDQDARLPVIQVEEYDSVTQFLEMDPADTFIARKLGMLEQAQKDGLL